MQISANTKVSDIAENGTAEQKAVAYYFDKDNNGIIDEKEASLFTSSQVELSPTSLKITSKDGQVSVFDNMAKAKSSEYYSQGSIPVAVLDHFSGSDNCLGMAGHGNTVANILKHENPNISVTRFNIAPQTVFTEEQDKYAQFLDQNPEIMQDLKDNEELDEVREYIKKIMKTLVPTYYTPYANALDKVKEQMDNGKEYKAVNISAAMGCTYDVLNSICQKELGIEITPENISQYREQIKNILTKKVQSGEISEIYDTKGKHSVELKHIISVIEKMEKLEIPIYVAQEYKAGDSEDEDDDNKTIQTLNLLSLAKNARTVEGGTQYNGSIQSPRSSTNSFAIDETTGERRIEDNLWFTTDSFERNSTSFATPMRLAKDLKN